MAEVDERLTELTTKYAHNRRKISAQSAQNPLGHTGSRGISCENNCPKPLPVMDPGVTVSNMEAQ